MRGAAEVHPWSSWHRLGLRSGVAAVGDETTNGEPTKMLSCIARAARFRNLRCHVM